MSPSSLEEISHSDAVNMWNLYQKGMAGPSVNYITTYHTYGMLHKIAEILTAVNSKGYKPKELEKFESLFQEAYAILALSDSKSGSDLSLGTQAVFALEGAPDWLAEIAMEEIRDGSTTD